MGIVQSFKNRFNGRIIVTEVVIDGEEEKVNVETVMYRGVFGRHCGFKRGLRKKATLEISLVMN